jgi:DNA-binding NarL/FixJ family response regulator
MSNTFINDAIKIIIADEHPIMREGLKRVIKKNSDMVVIGEAINEQELLEKSLIYDCDIVVIDFAISSGNILDIIRNLKGWHPEVHILVLSSYIEKHIASRVLKSGADGFIDKNIAPKELVNAIRKVFYGCKYISIPLAEELAFDLEVNKRG